MHGLTVALPRAFLKKDPIKKKPPGAPRPGPIPPHIVVRKAGFVFVNGVYKLYEDGKSWRCRKTGAKLFWDKTKMQWQITYSGAVR